MKPHALITNDDGIESRFLHRLVEALLPDFRISVAAPAFEQSWIGRAVTRHGTIEVIKSPSYFPPDVEAWAISGTPTDCINIALGNLLPERPDIVLSGINVGYNTTEALILCSGTVAGATEGALWDPPAIAFSHCIPAHLFEGIRDSKGQTTGEFTQSLASAADHARQIAFDTLQHPPKSGTVLNINFPAHTTAKTPIEDTHLAKIHLGSLYTETSPGKYEFRFNEGTSQESHPQTDRAALERGSISRSLLDFSKITARNEPKYPNS